MSAEHQSTDDIESRAADWILRFDRGQTSREDRAELEIWLKADSRHREAYLRLDEAWRLSAGLKTWRPADGAVNFHVLGSKAPLATERRGVRAWALAASVILIAATALIIWNRTAPAPTYATQVGGYQRVLLDDGSVVQLNTDTQLRVQMNDSKREIELLRGEAYFDVAPSPKRPFYVRSGDTAVQALGTRFTVRRKASGTEVTVTQGKVAVLKDGDTLTHTSSSMPVLVAGQTADVEASAIKVERLRTDELDRRLAWQEGQLKFKKQPLAEVVAEFNRYNRRRLEIEDPRLADVEVGGNFKANDLESFLAAMHSALGIQAEEVDGVIRLR